MDDDPRDQLPLTCGKPMCPLSSVLSSQPAVTNHAGLMVEFTLLCPLPKDHEGDCAEALVKMRSPFFEANKEIRE